MAKYRQVSDYFGKVKIAADCLWGAQTERALHHFCLHGMPMPKALIPAIGIVKRAAAVVNCMQGSLSKGKADMIVRVCDEVIGGKLDAHFPLNSWFTGSGTQFNINANEVIANRCSQIAKKPLDSRVPVHPNDDVNMSQSSNDVIPSVMNIAAAMEVKKSLLPTLKELRDHLHAKARQWKNIVKLGRTHMQDATPLTLGQEFSGYVGMLDDNMQEIQYALGALYKLAIGGTAVGTGINTIEGFDSQMAKEIARLTGLPFTAAKNKFSVQGAHNGLVGMSACLKTLAVSLYKIANDIRLLSCGPRAGFYELKIPSYEPGSSIMPGKVNPTQCEALSMVAVQVMANDMAVSFGGASGYLEVNVYKPLMIYNLIHSIQILRDASANFDKFLVVGIEPNKKKITEYVEKSLMLVTSLSPVIGYDKAAYIAEYASERDMELRRAAIELGMVTPEIFDRYVDPLKMCYPAKKTTKKKK